jgi:archaemetzincin
VEPDLLAYLSLAIPGVFDRPCSESGVVVDPLSAYDSKRAQYHSTKLLARLLDNEAENGNRILGVTEADLFIPILTFVFGEAQLGGRVALMSTHRLRPQFYGLGDNKNLFYSRCEKEATHELGHTWGLVHCASYDCAMHVSNSVEQVDLKPASFCDRCKTVISGSANATSSLVT